MGQQTYYVTYKYQGPEGWGSWFCSFETLEQAQDHKQNLIDRFGDRVADIKILTEQEYENRTDD